MEGLQGRTVTIAEARTWRGPRRGRVSKSPGTTRLETQGLGDARPVADNKTEEGRAKNRRVELVKL